MTRFGVLCCPNWAVAVAGAADAEAVVVLHANRVVALSSAAAAHGIAAGMRRRQAQSRAPGARLVVHDPDGDGRAFERVARAVGEMVPRFEVGEPGLLSFAARGPARYFGGETAMAAQLVELAVGAAGGSSSAAGGFGIGIADGRFAAGIAARRSARRGRPEIVTAGGSATYLAPLPVTLLQVVAGLPAELVGLFHRMGLRCLGDLAGVEESDLLARFGGPGRFAHQLARGDDPRPPAAKDPPAGFAVQREFDEVHHSDVVVFAARTLAEELIGTLAGGGQVCTRLEVVVETDHGERCERVWHRPLGLSAAAVVERVRWQLDGWASEQTLTAGITLLRLDPIEVRADDGVQQGLWGGRTQADEWAVRAVNRLIAIAGEHQVLVPEQRGGRLPHEGFAWVPAGVADLHDPQQRLLGIDGPWPGAGGGPAPTVIHAHPLAIEVVDDAGVVVGVSGRGAVLGTPRRVRLPNGDRRPVTGWAGPWPVEQRWWDPDRARRLARFQLLLDDGSLIEAAVEQQQWWLLAEHA